MTLSDIERVIILRHFSVENDTIYRDNSRLESTQKRYNELGRAVSEGPSSATDNRRDTRVNTLLLNSLLISAGNRLSCKRGITRRYGYERRIEPSAFLRGEPLPFTFASVIETIVATLEETLHCSACSLLRL